MVGLHSGWVGESYDMPRAFYDLYIIIVYTTVLLYSGPYRVPVRCLVQNNYLQSFSHLISSIEKNLEQIE